MANSLDMSPTKRTQIIREYKLDRKKRKMAARARKKMAAYKKKGYISL